MYHLCVQIHMHLISSPRHDKILIWVSALVFMLEQTVDFCGHYTSSFSTLSKGETWKDIGIFWESIRFHESNLTQCITFFQIVLCLRYHNSAIDWKTVEIWDMAHSQWDKIYLKRLNDYWHWNSNQLKLFHLDWKIKFLAWSSSACAWTFAGASYRPSHQSLFTPIQCSTFCQVNCPKIIHVIHLTHF